MTYGATRGHHGCPWDRRVLQQKSHLQIMLTTLSCFLTQKFPFASIIHNLGIILNLHCLPPTSFMSVGQLNSQYTMLQDMQKNPTLEHNLERKILMEPSSTECFEQDYMMWFPVIAGDQTQLTRKHLAVLCSRLLNDFKFATWTLPSTAEWHTIFQANPACKWMRYALLKRNLTMQQVAFVP